MMCPCLRARESAEIGAGAQDSHETGDDSRAGMPSTRGHATPLPIGKDNIHHTVKLECRYLSIIITTNLLHALCAAIRFRS